MAASGVTSDNNTNGYTCVKVKELHMSPVYPSRSDETEVKDFLSVPTERRDFRKGAVAALGRSCRFCFGHESHVDEHQLPVLQ